MVTREVTGGPFCPSCGGPDRGNVIEALSSASELEHVGLAEALELCLLLADKEPQRFGRAAVRWHGRFCREANVVSRKPRPCSPLSRSWLESGSETRRSLWRSFSAGGGWNVLARHLWLGRERRRTN